MNALSEQERARVDLLAARLRQVYSDMLQSDSTVRIRVLQETIQDGFREVPGGTQERFGEHLLSRFPVSGHLVSKLAPPASAQSEAPPETPEELAQRLLKLMTNLPEERRRSIAKALLDNAAVRPSVSGGISPDVMNALRVELNIDPATDIRLERLPDLVSRLAGLFQDIDRLLMTAWQEIGVRTGSASETASDFRQSLGQLLTAPEPKKGDKPRKFDLHEARIREMLFGVLTAVVAGGKEFGQRFLSKCSPERIENVIATEARTAIFGPTPKERSWERYKLLVAEFGTLDLIVRAVKDSMREALRKAATTAEAGYSRALGDRNSTARAGENQGG